MVYVDMDQGIHYRKKVAWNEKRKNIHRFSDDKNVANFEGFHEVISSSINLLFLKSDYIVYLPSSVWYLV